MPDRKPVSLGRIGYIVKRYPRFSETFIVTELLAHESAGMRAEIFALLPCTDTHFQDAIARVRAEVRYLPPENPKGAELWATICQVAAAMPLAWDVLREAAEERVVMRDLNQALHLARAVKERNIVHLHAHFATSAVTVARLAARIAGIRFTFTAHAKDIFHDDVEPDDLRRKLASAAAVVTVSDFNREFLVKRFGKSAARVRRIYNGIDLAAFPFHPPVDRPPLIVGVGRLVEKKGFADLIDACKVLRQRKKKFKCEIAGEGELRDALAAQIARLKLGGVVTLLGPQPQPRVAELLTRAAAFAGPCVVGQDGNRDGLPTVLLEAMALGTPCISTNVTGIPEIIRHDETGLLVAEHDPIALADGLERLMDDETLRVRLAKSARALIEESFDIRRNAAELRKIFAKCATRSKPKRKRSPARVRV